MLSAKKPPMAKIELEIGYKKSINRETRILGVNEDLYYTSQGMEQYKGYTISEIDPLLGTVSFTNGEVIKAGDVMGDVSEKDMRRIQIRETILSHFEKEEKLYIWGLRRFPYFSLTKLRSIVNMMRMEMKFLANTERCLNRNILPFLTII